MAQFSGNIKTVFSTIWMKNAMLSKICQKGKELSQSYVVHKNKKNMGTMMPN